jgi:hypothetical protein
VIVFFARPAGRQLNLAQFSVNERNIMSYTTLHCITWRDFNARAYAVWTLGNNSRYNSCIVGQWWSRQGI